MIRILIVEDTAAEADKLVACIERYQADKDEQFAIERMSSAFEFTERKPQADLIFMDIDMPGLTGMEAAEYLREYDENVVLIFVTNLAQYAVHGYAVNALDFIVKPIEYPDFLLRMDRAMVHLRKNRGATITIATANGVRIVYLRDVLYVDLLKHDLHYHLSSSEESLRVRGSIRAAQEELGTDFVRVSSGCLANMYQVRLIRQNSIVLSSGKELFFSRGCRKEALATLNAFVGRSV